VNFVNATTRNTLAFEII